jgi:VanZ family protein
MPSFLRDLKFMSNLAGILFWVIAALVFYGELGPGDIGFNIWDKLQHFGAYALMAGLLTVSLEARRWWLWGLLALVGFGAGLEVLQGVVGRDMSFKDEVANTLGVIAGGASGWSLVAMLRAWVVEVPAGD